MSTSINRFYPRDRLKDVAGYMYVVIDTPVMRDLIKNPNIIERLIKYIGSTLMVLIITYTLGRQYRNVIGISINDLRRIFRSIGYRVRVNDLSKSYEERVLEEYRDLVVLIENTISTNRHLGKDDALIIVCTYIYAYKKAHARNLFVVTKGRHVDSYSYPKHIIEEILDTPYCWYKVIDFNSIK